MFGAEKGQQKTAKQTESAQGDDQGRKAKKGDQRGVKAAQNCPDQGSDDEDQPKRGVRIDQTNSLTVPYIEKAATAVKETSIPPERSAV